MLHSKGVLGYAPASLKIPVLFAFLAIFSALLDCQSPVKAPDYACHRTDHFAVYFLESEYSLPEVKRFAEKKERLLVYIDSVLEVRYGGTIDTYLFVNETSDKRYAAIASPEGATCESWMYLMYDNGHEIIHIVAFSELGVSGNRFIVEGLATAFELDVYTPDPIERFVSECDNLGSFIATYDSIAVQIRETRFSGTSDEYGRAGAFVKYLANEYGIQKIKQWYTASVTQSGAWFDQTTAAIFGSTLNELEIRFYGAYFAPDSVN